MAARRDYHERSSVDMASSALKDAAGGRFDLGGLEAVIAVNSSGYLSPGVAEMLGESHGVGRRNALRFNLIGHGCAGAIPGLQLADCLAASGRVRTAAVVCTEPLLGLHNAASRDRADLLARVIFGEGAAAVILTDRDVSEGRLPGVVDSEVLLGEGSLDYVGLRNEDQWACRIDRRVPTVGGGLAVKAVGELLRRHGHAAGRVGHGAFHTGGRRVLDACQEGFGLTDEAMRPSREVLQNYGNMQSASVMFSMKRLLDGRRPKSGELGCMVAIGPGMLAGGVLLEWCLERFARSVRPA